MYTGISSISWTELVMKHSFNGIVNPFKVVTFWVYAMCPAFLALLTFTFWNHMQNDQKLLLNLRGILEMTLSQLLFHFGKQAEITRSQIRWAKRMREHSHTARMHWQSSTIQHNVMVNKLVLVPPLFWMFSADLLPEVMLVNHLAWRNKLLMNNNWQSKKKKRASTCSWCPKWLCCFLQTWQDHAFPMTRLLSGFWAIRVNPGFVFWISDVVSPKFEVNVMPMHCASNLDIRNCGVHVKHPKQTPPEKQSRGL